MAFKLSSLLLAVGVGLKLQAVQAQAITGTFPATPLASKRFAYPTGVPYKVDTDVGLIRGTQAGYNICNSTTEGPESLCQTSFVNDIDDFCLWAPEEPNSVIGDVEGETVAWCTKPGRGTRLIPAGALKGVQFMRTSAYVQVVGFIDQTQINIQAGDFGGEMDPHGADVRGNPMGGLLYSNAFSGNENNYDQIVEWTNFMGSDTFCIKACTQSNPSAPDFCEHIYDRIGCFYNMPNTAANGTFTSCQGETQDFPGIYTDAAGAVQTYKQPGEGTAPTPASTYTPRIPSSSECVTYTSSVLFSALGAVSASTPASTTGTASATSTGTGSRTTSPGPSNTGASASATSTGNAAVGGKVVSGAMIGAVGAVLAVLA